MTVRPGATTALAAVVVPVLGRPHRIAPLLADLEAATPEPHRVVFVCDPDDHPTIEACAAAGADWILDTSPAPTYASKINLGYRSTVEPWIFTGADDLHFHPGWLGQALATANTWRAAISVIGTNDLANSAVVAGRHSTHSLVARTYADHPGGAWGEPGTILHEGYPHEYCDDELVNVAIARGRFVHDPACLVEHLHHKVDKSADDDTYRLGRSRRRASAAVYARRRPLWS